MIRSCTRSRLIANHLNVLASAVISATTQRPSDAIRLLDATPGGSGSLHLAGPFTGAVDSDVEAEIISLAGGTVVAGTPVTHGVGSGALSVTALRAGATAETLELTLLDAGEPSKSATYDFFGYEIAARVPGIAGNSLRIEVERRLTLTPTSHSAIERIATGTTELVGPIWEWGQPAGQGATVPPDALRIQFEGHPTVHRAWRQWRNNQWVYRLDPAPAFDVLPDTRILAVTGDYRLTLTDGVTTEVFDVVTIHDFLSALDARSALVEVRAPLSRDRTAGGMSVLDVPLRSDAHALPPKFSTRIDARIAITAVDPATSTGNLTLTHAGAGRWSVTGPDGSQWSAATVGVPYAGPVSFTLTSPPVPQVYAPCPTFKMSYASREATEGQPAVCLKPFTLGAAARDKELTFIYTRRPPAECSCNGMAPLQLSAACLGLEDDMSITDPAYMDRIKDVYAWRAAFVRANTLIQGASSTYVPGTSGTPGTPGTAGTPDRDLYTVSATVRGSDPGNADPTARSFSVGIFSSQLEAPMVEGVKSALSGWVMPAGTKSGSSVSIGGVSFSVEPIYCMGAFGDSCGLLYASDPVSASDITSKVSGTRPGTPGTSGSAGTPGTSGYTVSTSLGYLAYKRDLDWMEATLPILLNCLGQVYSDAGALALWDALWAEVQVDLDPLEPTKDDLAEDEVLRNQRFLDRYAAVCDTILLEAGILPKSDASSEGSDCWRDHGDAFWWAEERGEYLPAFTNRAYISARRSADGKIRSTQEFGFGLLVACPERLKEGDRLTISITGTANASAAGEGDTITVPIVAGQAAFFSYGAGGQPVQTWTVRGSVSGALPDWLRDLDAPAPYTAAASPAELELADGGIPFEAGDRIRVDLFAGRLRWRRDGGAWSEADIFADHAVGDGLTLSARVGSAPAFAVGNRWRFAAEARYGIAKLRQPRPGEAFAWDGDSVTLTATWATPQPAEVVAVALADLPPGAVLTLTATDAAAVVTTTTANVIDGVALFRLGMQVQLAEARLSITHAGTGGAIGWLFAGMGWRPTVGASTLSRSRQYGLTRGARAGSGALYSGRGVGGEWSWQVSDGGVLLDDTCRSLQTLLDHVAKHDNEPILLVPDLNDPTLASVAVLAADEIRFDDELGWQGGEQWRHVSVSLPFDAVLEAA